MEVLTFLEDKNNDRITKNGYLANKLPIGLEVPTSDGSSILLRDFEISDSDGTIEDIVTDRRFTNSEKVTTLILAASLKRLGSLKEADINESVVERLTDIDRDYLLTKFRDFSFGEDEPLKGKITCDNCSNTDKLEHIDLNSLVVKKISDDKEYFEKYKIIKVNLDKPFTFRKKEADLFSVRLPIGIDKEKAAHLANINFNKWRTKIMLDCLLQIGDEVPSFTLNEIKNIKTPIRKKIWRAIDDIDLGINKTIEHQCSSCNNIFEGTIIFDNLLPLW